MYDIVIIGAGASGLTAAYRAASVNPQLKILVLEKQSVCGRKLSASGNGKCNLTNDVFSADCYDSENPSFVETFVNEHSPQEIVTFFRELGILLYEKNGYYYPLSNQAKQVTKLLYEKCLAKQVQFAFRTTVTRVRKGYELETISGGETKNYRAKRVILAAGSAASPKLGGDVLGYDIARQLDMRLCDVSPVLSPVYVDDSYLCVARGVRIDGMAAVRTNAGGWKKERGQIQFNEQSLSGIVMMNLSCELNRLKESKDGVHIDLIPDMSWDKVNEFIKQRIIVSPEESLYLMLNGFLPEGMVQYLTKRLQLDGNARIGMLTKKQQNRLTSNLKKLSFTPVMHIDYNKAQAAAGGIATQEVNPHTFASIRCPGVYITGEILDMTGKCGGYNLTFAILSGISAADHIVGE